ncbi:CHAD domain-containing protein [Ignavibacterium sp.]|uniref:CHAD domain-containing protein n=1 Tax=Ignavibacterium sp. TaxID=2651167 RepID=UPI00307D8FB2
MSKKKWKVEKLRYSKHLLKIANTILLNRFDNLLFYIDEYFKTKEIEPLHDVRIALRRVRYNMELFLVCYEKKLFMRLYYKIEKLQDLSGSVRDLDVFLENINLLKKDNVEVSDTLEYKIKEKRHNLQEEFEKELKKFVKSRTLKSFFKIIS